MGPIRIKPQMLYLGAAMHLMAVGPWHSERMMFTRGKEGSCLSPINTLVGGATSFGHRDTSAEALLNPEMGLGAVALSGSRWVSTRDLGTQRSSHPKQCMSLPSPSQDNPTAFRSQLRCFRPNQQVLRLCLPSLGVPKSWIFSFWLQK